MFGWQMVGGVEIILCERDFGAADYVIEWTCQGLFNITLAGAWTNCSLLLVNHASMGMSVIRELPAQHVPWHGRWRAGYARPPCPGPACKVRLVSLTLDSHWLCGFRPEEPSPQWLKELKSKKRQSLYENQA